MIHCTQKRWVCLEPRQLTFFPSCPSPTYAEPVAAAHSAVRGTMTEECPSGSLPLVYYDLSMLQTFVDQLRLEKCSRAGTFSSRGSSENNQRAPRSFGYGTPAALWCD